MPSTDLAMITVSVKWGKQMLENVELDTAGPVELFKAQLYTLTQARPPLSLLGAAGCALASDRIGVIACSDRVVVRPS